MLLNGNPEIRQSGGRYSSGDDSQFSGSEKMMSSRKLICSWLAVPQYQFTRAHMNNFSTLPYMIEPFCQRFAVYFQHNFGDAGTHFAGDVLFAAFDVSPEFGIGGGIGYGAGKFADNLFIFAALFF